MQIISRLNDHFAARREEFSPLSTRGRGVDVEQPVELGDCVFYARREGEAGPCWREIDHIGDYIRNGWASR